MKEEQWIDVPGYEGEYRVSNKGEVKSIKFGRELIMKQTLNRSGYNQIWLCGFNRKRFYVHRLVFFSFMKFLPDANDKVIDHIDSNKLNNSIDNLRVITHRDNMSKERTKKSALPVGVSYRYNYMNTRKDTKKYRSYITINGSIKHLGYFDNIDEASDAYIKAKLSI